MKKGKKDEQLLEIEGLRLRLDEAEEALRAIRMGEVDALVVSTPQGDQIFSLKSADYPYRVFLEAMHEGAVTLDPDGAILFGNRCFSEILQVPLEKLIGAKFQQFVAPGNQKLFEAAFRRREQEDGKAEIYLKRKTGPPVPVLVTFNLMPTVAGRFTCVVVTDLSEHKLAEEKIQAELAFRKSIEDSTIVGITALDLEGRQLFANTGFCRMVDWPQEELDGKMLPFVYWPPEEAAALKKLFESGIEGEENSAGFESRYLRRDGETFDVLIQQSPLKDARGKITGLVRSAIDITARKKMAAALEYSEKNLRSLSVQLLESQEKERKRIASEIHDILGSGLAAVKFKLEDLAASVSTVDPRTLADSINNLIPLTIEIIGEIRRMQSNLRPPTLDELGILATLTWFCRQFHSIYTGIRIESHLEIREEEIPDPLKITLFRVAQEALNNVAKHGRADHVLLSLQKKGPETELIIADNGAGIDLEELGRKEPSEKGIGLASMKERIEISGGRFQIQSVPGKGTTVKASWLPDP